jgi:hypothetical protein
MPLTDTQFQTLITSEIKPGKLTSILEDGGEALSEFEVNLPLWWMMFEDKKTWGPRLRYLYVKKQAIEWLMGQNWDAVDYGDADVNERLSQYMEHLEQMLQPLQTEIEKIELRRRSLGMASGVITRTAPRLASDELAPVESTQTLPEANDPMYRGDAYRRRVRVYPR